MHVSALIRQCSCFALVVAAVSACSDAVTTPRAAERPPFDLQALQPLASRDGAPEQKGPKSDPGPKPKVVHIDSSTKTLTIDPNVSHTYAFGDDWISFPAHSVCDPETSGYGPSFWDAPCTPVSKPVKVTVHWSRRGGYAFAHFSPELRFVPADAQSVSRWVILSLHAQKQLQDLSAYTILYSSGENTWVDESLADPTLLAWLDKPHNSVVRRVKHFSGYMVAAAYNGMGGM
jgi:hypothetical protein